jgi:hypothetical protein
MTTTILQNSFLPTQISGCQLWLDAADSSTMTGTSPITAWRDKSGNGNNGTASGSPVLLANSINTSYPSVYFDGASSFAGTTINSGTTLTAFCILQTTDANLNTNGRLLSLSSPGRNDYDNVQSCIAYDQFNNAQINTNRGNRGTVQVVYNVPVGTSALVATIFDGNTSNTFYGNGSLQFTSTDPSWNQNFSITTYCIGNAINPNTALYKGRIGEIILYTTALTTTQRQQVEGYLAQKWGLQASLPSNHPYKYSAYFTNLGYVSTILSPVNTNQITNAAFLPTSIPGCSLWLDAADQSAITFTSGTTVSLWKDKSGNGNNGTPNTGVTWAANGFGTNLPAMTFTTTQWFTGNISITGDQLTAFSVFNMSSSSQTYPRVISLGAPGASAYNNNSYMITVALGGSTQFVNYRNNVTTPTSFNISFNTNELTSSWVDGRNSYLSQYGGTPVSVGSSNNFNVSSYAIGTDTDTSATTHFYGYISEIIVYNIALTTAQRQQVEGYLAWKWGLQGGLPSTHPYKYTSAVFVTQPRALTILGANPYNNTMVSRYFNPTSIAGTQLWLDAADPSTITGTSPVTAWRDKSGNGNNGTASGSPVLLANSINGSYPSIYFNGSSSIAGTTVVSGPTLTAFCILQTTDTNLSTNGRLLSLSTPGQNDYNTNLTLSAFIQLNPTYICTSRGSTGSAGTITYDVPVGTSALVATTFAGNTSNTFYGNGSLFVTSTDPNWNTNFSITTYCIGNAINPNGAWYKGRIGEIILYSTALTNPQRQQVEGYLAWKWGIQSKLPPTHLYKNYPPSP